MAIIKDESPGRALYRTTQQAHPHSPEQREPQAEHECPTERTRWYRRAHAVQWRFSTRKERLARVPLCGLDAHPVFQRDREVATRAWMIGRAIRS